MILSIFTQSLIKYGRSRKNQSTQFNKKIKMNTFDVINVYKKLINNVSDLQFDEQFFLHDIF